jgi:hypothetical protein
MDLTCNKRLIICVIRIGLGIGLAAADPLVAAVIDSIPILDGTVGAHAC